MPSMEEEQALQRKEIDYIHATFEARGTNSRQTKDVFGRVFLLPVDEEHKVRAQHMLPTLACLLLCV